MVKELDIQTINDDNDMQETQRVVLFYQGLLVNMTCLCRLYTLVPLTYRVQIESC